MLKNAKILGLHFLVLLFIGFSLTSLLGNPRISYDGWQYISSAMAIGDGTLAENFFWVRQPGYPFLINLSFSLGNSIWPLIWMQVFIFTASYTFFIWQARKYFLTLTGVKFVVVTSFAYFFIVVFLGGYNLAVLPQSITSSYLMIVVGVLLHFYRVFILGELRPYSRVIGLFAFPLLLIVGYSIAPILSYLVLFLHLVFVLFVITKFFREERTWKIRQVPLLSKYVAIGLILSLLSFVLFSLFWSIFSHQYINSPGFNLNQLKDPFWGIGLNDYFNNVKEDPQILHFVPASFLALLMLIPNLGWNGLVIEKPLSFHSQNADVGFGLFSTNYSNCTSFPGQVLAVDEKYIQGLGLQDSCSLANLDLPQLTFFPIMLVWLVICVYWLWNVIVLRKPIFILFSTVPVIYLSSYALLGAGIDRYGSSVYPIIIVIALLDFSPRWLDLPRKGAHQGFNS